MAQKIGRNEQCPCGSGKKFKFCHLNTGGLVVKTRLTFPELAERLRDASAREQLHPVSILASVLLRVRQTIAPAGWHTRDGVPVHVAGAAMLAACYRNRVPEFEAGDVPVTLGAHADELLDDIRHRLKPSFGTSVKEPVLDALQRASVGGASSASHAFGLYRTLYLLEVEVSSGIPTSPYNALFEKMFGCSVGEYLAVLCNVWVYAATKGEFLDRSFLKSALDPERMATIADRIFVEHSCRIQEVKQIIDETIKHHGVEGMVGSFFARYPFIEVRPGLFTPAPHPYVRLLAMTLPLFKMLQLATQRDGGAEPEESRLVGRRFETMLTQLLSVGFAADQIVHEHAADSKGDRRSPDAFLFESAGVTVLEGKIKRLHPNAFFGFSLEALRSDVAGAVSRSIRQMISFLAWLDATPNHRLTPEAVATKHRIAEAKKIFFLGVFAALPPIFHVDDFRRMAEEELQAQLSEQAHTWLKRNADRVSGWHVIDSEELARVVGRQRSFGLHEALAAYVATPYFRAPVRGDAIPPSFSDHVRELGGRLELRSVDENVQAFLRWALKHVHGPEFLNEMYREQ